MENKDLNIDEVRLNDWNPNEMSSEKVMHLSTIINTLGFLQNIVVWKKTDGTFVCLDGEHRLKALDIAEIEKVDAKILSTQDLVKMGIKMREQGLLSFNIEPSKEQELAQLVAEFITILMNKIRGRENPQKASMIYARALEKKVQSAELLEIFDMKEQELDAYMALAREKEKSKEEAISIIKKDKPQMEELRLLLRDEDMNVLRRAIGHTSQADITEGIMVIVKEYCIAHNIPIETVEVEKTEQPEEAGAE